MLPLPLIPILPPPSTPAPPHHNLPPTNTPDHDVRTKAHELRALYANDLETSFGDECVHFQAYITKKVVSTNPKQTTPLDMCRILRNDDLVTLFPNVDIALRMYACTPAANCTAERSFSCLKRVKSYLRSKMTNDRLNSLAILAIEAQLVRSLNYTEIIDDFATLKARRKQL